MGAVYINTPFHQFCCRLGLKRVLLTVKAQKQTRCFLQTTQNTHCLIRFFLLSSGKSTNCFFKYCFIIESWIERCLNESESKRYSSHTSLGNMSNDERKQEKHFNRANCGSANVRVRTEVQSVQNMCLCHRCALIICFGRLLQRRKKKITEPLNLIRHQPLWNGELSRTNY